MRSNFSIDLEKRLPYIFNFLIFVIFKFKFIFALSQQPFNKSFKSMAKKYILEERGKTIEIETIQYCSWSSTTIRNYLWYLKIVKDNKFQKKEKFTKPPSFFFSNRFSNIHSNLCGYKTALLQCNWNYFILVLL